MMNIKFRAWNTLVNRYQYFDLKELTEVEGEIKWDHLIFEQFTGCRNNGKEIYENDILRYLDYDPTSEEENYNIGVVGFCASSLKFFVGGKEFVEDEEIFWCPDTEVIGNIHEHKHLFN